MILTEYQAKRKTCPFMPLNASDNTTQYYSCNGSGCMAWRWYGEVSSGVHPFAEVVVADPPRGYCGAAGIPGRAAP